MGSAYVDRWETTIPGESLIRNILLGKSWCRDVLGIDNPTVTHPDLPSLTPQISQIYHQLGLKYYITSRKVFPHGQIWRYRAPDGSRMMMLNWPRHYVFVPTLPWTFGRNGNCPDMGNHRAIRPRPVFRSFIGRSGVGCRFSGGGSSTPGWKAWQLGIGCSCLGYPHRAVKKRGRDLRLEDVIPRLPGNSF